MSRKGQRGTCIACGLPERKETFFGMCNERYLYYCIAPHCEMNGVTICKECWKQMSKLHYDKGKCPICSFGHMRRKDDWQA